jgi:hypothetical protein
MKIRSGGGGGKPICSMRTDGQTGMTLFRNFVNAPKNETGQGLVRLEERGNASTRSGLGKHSGKCG